MKLISQHRTDQEALRCLEGVDGMATTMIGLAIMTTKEEEEERHDSLRKLCAKLLFWQALRPAFGSDNKERTTLVMIWCALPTIEAVSLEAKVTKKAGRRQYSMTWASHPVLTSWRQRTGGKLSLGDARAYYLSTAKNELGVVSAQSLTGQTSDTRIHSTIGHDIPGSFLVTSGPTVRGNACHNQLHLTPPISVHTLFPTKVPALKDVIFLVQLRTTSVTGKRRSELIHHLSSGQPGWSYARRRLQKPLNSPS
ncbi:hypothetical protein AXF42_Ash006877 [Apostasia shenzhenica]|uniref:Uncharacterized protein n=1 Tax=Apostasia shenzhenica TaxID=1088818 RepID=A0A2I0BEF1_9ASPA|nr:hypothetical protein AXF42_Ash006877 [Apostasia shenzhenica]